jgi:hypothetical protein
MTAIGGVRTSLAGGGEEDAGQPCAVTRPAGVDVWPLGA